MMKFFKNNKGFSLAEITIAAGLLGALSLVIANISKQGNRIEVKASTDQEVNIWTNEIFNHLSSQGACDATFKNKPIPDNKTSGTAYTQKHPTDTTLAGTAVDFGTAAATRGNGEKKVVLSGYKITLNGGSSAKVDYTFTIGTTNPINRTKSITLAVYVAAGNVTSCYADTSAAVHAACGALYGSADGSGKCVNIGSGTPVQGVSRFAEINTTTGTATNLTSTNASVTNLTTSAFTLLANGAYGTAGGIAIGDLQYKIYSQGLEIFFQNTAGGGYSFLNAGGATVSRITNAGSLTASNATFTNDIYVGGSVNANAAILDSAEIKGAGLNINQTTGSGKFTAIHSRKLGQTVHSNFEDDEYVTKNWVKSNYFGLSGLGATEASAIAANVISASSGSGGIMTMQQLVCNNTQVENGASYISSSWNTTTNKCQIFPWTLNGQMIVNYNGGHYKNYLTSGTTDWGVVKGDRIQVAKTPSNYGATLYPAGLMLSRPGDTAWIHNDPISGTSDNTGELGVRANWTSNTAMIIRNSGIEFFGTNPSDNVMTLDTQVKINKNLKVWGASDFTGNMNIAGSVTATNYMRAKNLIADTITETKTLDVYTDGTIGGSLTVAYSVLADGVLATNTIRGKNVYADDYMYATSFVASSDRRLKKEIVSLDDDVVSKLLNLRPVKYKLIKDNSNAIGLIAQEVDLIFPELVGNNGKYLGVNYIGLISPLIKAFQYEHQEIEKLKAENVELKQEISALREDIEELKKYIKK